MGGFLLIAPADIPVIRHSSHGMLPSMSINKTGRLGFNGAAVDQFGISQAYQIQILWDADKRRLGFRVGAPFTSVEAAKAYTLRKQGKFGAGLGLKGLWLYLGIDISAGIRAPITYDETTRLCIAQLPIEAKPSKNGKAAIAVAVEAAVARVVAAGAPV